MAKAKRSRDYRAEEARRNQRAKALGFTTRAQLRRAQKYGYKPPRKTANPRSPIVPLLGQPIRPRDLAQFTAKATRKPPAKPVGGGALPGTGGRLQRLRRESQAWSNRHSRLDTSRFDPSFPAERVRRYHAAFVDPDTRAWKIENGLDSLRDYLVDEMGFYDDIEFDERYGIDVAI